MLIRKKEEPLEDILMRAKVSRMQEEHQRQVQELQSRVEELAARPPPAPAELRVTLDAGALETLSTAQSVALGKTLEALAQMLPGPPKFTTGETKAIPIPQLAKMIRTDSIVRGICFQVGGTGPANYLLILQEEDADRVVALMTGSPPGGMAPADYGAALKEFGNIFCTSNLNELSKIHKVTLNPSAPVLVTDMMPSLVDFTLAGARPWGGEVAVATLLNVSGAQGDIRCFFYLIPGKELVKALLG